MRINSSQEVVVDNGGVKTLPVRSDLTYTQVTVSGRNAGEVTVTARPLLKSNEEADFLPAEFEEIAEGKINLAAVKPKRTFTIENKRLTALHFADNTPGNDYEILINQWSPATST